jgi:glycosyltransferase involved in cell wall biosynthesis
MQRSYNLMRELSHHHQVSVVALRQRAHQSSQAALSEAISAISEFADVRHVSELPQDTYPGRQAGLALRALLPGLPFTIRWALSEQYRLAVREAVESIRPDVVHFDTISLASYLDEIGTIPAILNHHNIESQMLLRRAGNQKNPMKRFYFWQEGRRLQRYEQAHCPRFARHLTCSGLDADRLRTEVPGVMTTVIPNGVDLAYFAPPAQEHPRKADSLIFVGGLGWYPNLDAMNYFVSQVWPRVRARCPTATLSIIGKKPAHLPEVIRQAPGLSLLGFVDDIRPVVHAHQVYVCPIRDGGGTKLKMLDAMAMGIPIVAHPVACEGLTLEHGHHVLMAQDPEEYAEHILRLFIRPEERQLLADRAHSHVTRHFSFRQIGLRLAETIGGLS